MAQAGGAEVSDWLLFGLGNPGERYRLTRHNLGWMLVDVLASRHRFTWIAGRGDYMAARGKWGSARIHLIKPTTFMNLSGRAVRQYLAIERPEHPEVIAAVDDVNIPLGRLRFRPRGQTGGHNGLESIEQSLRSRDFARLRMGCGPLPEGADLSDYVLEDFAADEMPAVHDMVDKAADAFECWVHEGPQTTMGRFNG